MSRPQSAPDPSSPNHVTRRTARIKDLEHQLAEAELQIQRLLARPPVNASESEAQFRSLADTTSAAIFIVTGLKILYANPAASATTGYASEELLGMDFSALAHPAYRAALTRQGGLAARWAEGLPVRYELKIQTSAGDERWLDLTAGDISFENQPATVVTAFDITERDRVEKALQKAKDELEIRIEERTEALQMERNFVLAVLETAGALVVVLDREGRIVRFNRACERMTGYTFDEVKDRAFWDLFLIQEEIQPVQRVFESLRAGEFPNSFENYWVTRDGNRRLIAWSNTALLGDDHQVEYVIGTGIDITERKRAEAQLLEALEASQRRQAEVAALLDGTQAVLTIHNFQETARAVFEHCKKLIGASAGYVALSTPDGDNQNKPLFLDPGELPCEVDISLPMPIRGLRERAYQAVETVYENQFPLSESVVLLPRGHLRLENVLFAPLVINHTAVGLLGLANKPGGFTENDARMATAFGEIVSIALINSQSQEALQKSHSQLEQRVAERTQELEATLREEQAVRARLIQSEKHAAVSRMVASIAHELNNPIQTVQNCLYLTGQDLSTESPIHEYLDMAVSEIERISRLVTQLREVYRPGRPVDMESCNLMVLLSEVQALLSPHLLHERVAWVQLPGPPEVPINGIADQLKQVFLNLSLNAIEAMQPSGGELTISVRLPIKTDQVCISFKDTGPGVSPENMPRLFEPFFTTKDAGSGLGLSICYDIVRGHGGQITLVSQAGQGAEFQVWLPLAQSTSGEQPSVV